MIPKNNIVIFIAEMMTMTMIFSKQTMIWHLEVYYNLPANLLRSYHCHEAYGNTYTPCDNMKWEYKYMVLWEYKSAISNDLKKWDDITQGPWNKSTTNKNSIQTYTTNKLELKTSIQTFPDYTHIITNHCLISLPTFVRDKRSIGPRRQCRWFSRFGFCFRIGIDRWNQRQWWNRGRRHGTCIDIRSGMFGLFCSSSRHCLRIGQFVE